MPKSTPIPTLAATIVTLLLAGSLPAQFRGGTFPSVQMPTSGAPQPLPGVPTTPPPVDHPALAAQPLIGDNGARATAPKPAAAGAAAKPARKPRDPATVGPKLAGKDLKKAVAKVTKTLKWCDTLTEARTAAAAHGKPILWVQALGEIDGFA
ncbi:MAG TPA: hypothetical protein VFZ65_20735 [Planctomycetota bacterium]|nr:hypothetical protein [Planctomycetota bacterium]